MSGESLRTRAIRRLEQNRISSTEVCDVMGKSGALVDIAPVVRGEYAAGKVKYVFAHCATNFHLHEQIADIEENCIVFVDAIDCEGRAVFGDLVAKYLLLYRNSRAVVTNGMLRDANELIKQRRKVWCAGFTPVGCHNISSAIPDDIEKIVAERKELFESSIIVCDDSGVALISGEHLNEDLVTKLDFIELQEDIWYYCIDTLKWSTFETVALKRYLEEPSALPPVLRDKLALHDVE